MKSLSLAATMIESRRSTRIFATSRSRPMCCHGPKRICLRKNRAAHHCHLKTAMPKIPIALFAGSEDPAGNFGTGVQAVAQRLRRDGHDVELHLYDGLRHEVHNEPLTRAEVEEEILGFIARVTARS